jgi:hypothetical protein
MICTIRILILFNGFLWMAFMQYLYFKKEEIKLRDENKFLFCIAILKDTKIRFHTDYLLYNNYDSHD